MKPYIEYKGEKLYLAQEVDPNRFEVAVNAVGGDPVFVLCPKLRTRYVQATGILLFREENELVFTWIKKELERITYPLGALEFIPIKIDWSAGKPIITAGTEELMQ
jgi:hypothetical protein